jgi:hypothetical protein
MTGSSILRGPRGSVLSLWRSARILVALVLACAVPAPAFASGLFFDAGFNVGLSVNFGPPALPVYVQPPCPAPNYLWNPGYWAWGAYGYYWVPGTWVAAPRPGLLWTPGYWAYNGGSYGWHSGYWAPHVGYYGGINYGFGYFGVGFGGGGWSGGAFRYNTAVTNVNTTIVRNVYVNKTVINNYYTTTNVSYNGGPRGVVAQPTQQEQAFAGERHIEPTVMQQEHMQVAGRDRTMLASVNNGRPAETAVAQPYSARSLPSNFTPVREEDRAAATRPVQGAVTGMRSEPAQTQRFDEQRGGESGRVDATPAQTERQSFEKAPAQTEPRATEQRATEPQVKEARPSYARPQTEDENDNAFRAPASTSRPNAARPQAEVAKQPAYRTSSSENRPSYAQHQSRPAAPPVRHTPAAPRAPEPRATR